MIDSAHKKNLLAVLRNAVFEYLESETVEHQAFVRVAADWLGYDGLEEDNYIDGKEDRGIDVWYETVSGFDLLQIKSHVIENENTLSLYPFDNSGVLDLQRIISYLTDPETTLEGSSKLLNFRKQWESAITRRRLGKSLDPKDPIRVQLSLVLFGQGLTEPAQEEFEAFARSLQRPYEYKEIPIEFRAGLYVLDDIIETRWRQDNRDWHDKSGHGRDYVDLHPSKEGGLSGLNNAVFYCRAIDLINAFEEFGYQIFEPNVRAHIGKSKVNSAIKDTLMGFNGRKEFQFLNNGVTIICGSYKKPVENRPAFRVMKPGVINGLQTIVALHEAYQNLNLASQKHLEESCYVLVRLMTENVVEDINKVVLASNTQNPMQARNLKSNTTEQVYFERLFAELGWFYERKQGAWEAFSKDPRRWRSLSNYRREHFKPDDKKNPKERRIDNEAAAQTWLAFIGFSHEAVHEKRYIFEDDRLYGLSFLHRAPQHGCSYKFHLANAVEEWTPEAPSHEMMLVSYLARQFAKEVSLSTKENREATCQRLGINPDNTLKEHLEIALAEDSEYVLEQVLSAMTYVFVEFFGHLLFTAFGETTHDLGHKLLANRSLNYLYRTNNFEPVVRSVRNDRFETGDALITSWHAFCHVVNQLLGGSWKQSYQAARSRTQFNHSPETRMRIYRELENLDKFMQKSQLTQSWAVGIPANTGIFDYLARLLTNKL